MTLAIVIILVCALAYVLASASLDALGCLADHLNRKARHAHHRHEGAGRPAAGSPA